MRLNKFCVLTMMGLAMSLLVLPPSADAEEPPRIGTAPQSRITVSGTVSDEGGSLAGVAVIEKGTRNGVVTDSDGRFSITVSSEASVLEFSSLGYATKEIPVGGQRLINVVLDSSNTMLDETVVVGYGTMRRKDVTGSISSADLGAFKTSQNVNIMQSLKGSVPGLTVSQTNHAGEDLSIQVRGVNTINGNTSPLVVVDGIIFTGSLNHINPADVKSVDILKDASSKAIYGSQAANGVILITTHSGEKNDKFAVHYSGSVTVSSPTKNHRFFNAEEMKDIMRGVYYQNAFLGPDYTTPNPDFSFETGTEMGPVPLEGLSKGIDYDWYGALTRTPVSTNHNVSVSGGNAKMSSYLSFGYTNSKAIVKNDDYNRYTARVNLSYDIKPWFSIGLNANGSFADYSGNSPSFGEIRDPVPFITPYDEQGNLITFPKGGSSILVNPFLIMYEDDKELRNELSGLAFAEVKIPFIEGLKNRVIFNKTFIWSNDYSSNQWGNNLTGSASKAHGEQYEHTLENILSYQRQFNDHSVDVTLVYGARKAGYDYFSASGTDYPNLALSYNSLQQAIIQKISSTAWAESQLYQMARLNYNFKNRYLLTATIRRDGFSGFASNHKFGYFGSPAKFRVRLSKDGAYPVHEEWQVGDASELSTEAFDFGVERFS